MAQEKQTESSGRMRSHLLRTSPHCSGPLLIATAFNPGSGCCPETSARWRLPSCKWWAPRTTPFLAITGAAVHPSQKEEIERSQPSSTQDVLRRVPLVSTRFAEERNGRCQQYRPNPRPLAKRGPKSADLEDGVPVAPGPVPFGSTRYFNPPAFKRCKGVEVLKGSSSLR